MKKDRALHYMFFTENIEENIAWLNEEETRHAVNVLRIKEGDEISFTNGMGWYFEGIFVSISRRIMEIKITKKIYIEKDIDSFTFCIGLPEKEAFEEVLINLTPFGVTKIIPIVSEYSEKSWNKGDWNKYSLRFRNKMISAMKQSLSCYLPSLISPVSFQEAFDSIIEDIAFVADVNGTILKEVFPKRENLKSIICFVGPPGGFSEKEVSCLKDRGVLPVKIANNRLRTELAAIGLCSQIVEKVMR
ncbi:MAG: 16S rRNA (uracil(1498)-N(3))-methyltransferase [Chitinispirillaceae bacterium]|nr:16S rRNA (uracil(1498)-N(3))-methyltransferase [Chitinispirillaceae bacterium]